MLGFGEESQATLYFRAVPINDLHFQGMVGIYTDVISPLVALEMT